MCALLRIKPLTAYYMRKRGDIDYVTLPSRHPNLHPQIYYTLDQVNRLLQKSAKNFAEGTIPTAEELLALPPHALLTSEEAIAILGMNRGSILRGVRRGHIPVFSLGPRPVIRFPARTITQYNAQTEDGTLLNAMVVARAFCMYRTSALVMFKRYGIPTQKVTGRDKTLFAKRSSIMELLAQSLFFITPEEWWEERVIRGGEVITGNQACKRWRIDPRTLEPLFRDGTLPYLSQGEGKQVTSTRRRYAIRRFIAPSGISAMDYRRLRLPQETVAKVIPLPADMLSPLLDKRRLCGLDHKHNVPCLTMECLKRYVHEHRTSDLFTADEWFTWSLQDGAAPTTSTALVETTVGVDEADVLEALTAGALRGIWLPSDIRAAVAHFDGLRFRRNMERRLFTD